MAAVPPFAITLKHTIRQGGNLCIRRTAANMIIHNLPYEGLAFLFVICCSVGISVPDEQWIV